MARPTYEQIQIIAQQVADSRPDGALHLWGGELSITVDGLHPRMSDVEFSDVRGDCAEIAFSMRMAAIERMFVPA